MVRAQASPHTPHRLKIMLGLTVLLNYQKQGQKASYYYPVMNHWRIFKCGSVKSYKSMSHHKWIHVLLLNQSSWQYPTEVQAIGHTVSVVFMHHGTLPSAAGIQGLGIKGRRHRKQAHTLQQEVTVNRNPLSPHRAVFIKDAKIKAPFNLLLNTHSLGTFFKSTVRHSGVHRKRNAM